MIVYPSILYGLSLNDQRVLVVIFLFRIGCNLIGW